MVDAPTGSPQRSRRAATKLHQEHLAAVFGREHDVSVTALRYHNVYGPRLPADTPYAGVAALFRSAVRRGEAPTVFEDGGQRRDFVHVRDVARANVAAPARPPRPTTRPSAQPSCAPARPARCSTWPTPWPDRPG